MRLVWLLVLGWSHAQAQNPAAAVNTDGTPRRDTVHRVEPGQMYYRIYARVPLQGKGTQDDPKRPMFASATAAPSNHKGIIAWQMQISDDGKWGLVEYVGANRNELLAIINSTDANVKVFERGKASQADIEGEFQKYKKGYKLDWSSARPQ